MTSWRSGSTSEPHPGWLLREGEVLAAVEVADRFSTRLHGLIGRDGVAGALVLRPARSVHTFGMRFAVDVAYCTDELVVIDVRTMKPNRMGKPRPRAKVVIEAEAGAFERWRLSVGDRLELRT